MNKLYILLGLAVIVCAAYWAGTRFGMQKCRATTAINQNEQQTITQENIIKIKGDIYAETVTSSTDVIRGRLREKYTIGI